MEILSLLLLLGQTVGAINGEQLKTKLEFEVGYSDRTRGGLQWYINKSFDFKIKVTRNNRSCCFSGCWCTTK
jgi:hypothetical protein